MTQPEFWVAVSMVLFLGVIIYMGVPGRIAGALDARGQRIANELAEAQRLREDAQALLAEYERKREEAEKAAADIVAQARSEAEAYVGEARRKFTDTLERRSANAEQKIAQAEAQAVKEVRAAAADLAVAAARRIIAAEVKGAKADEIVEASIGAVKSQLN